jgi:hypothetical protein
MYVYIYIQSHKARLISHPSSRYFQPFPAFWSAARPSLRSMAHFSLHDHAEHMLRMTEVWGLLIVWYVVGTQYYAHMRTYIHNHIYSYLFICIYIIHIYVYANSVLFMYLSYMPLTALKKLWGIYKFGQWIPPLPSESLNCSLPKSCVSCSNPHMFLADSHLQF